MIENALVLILLIAICLLTDVAILILAKIFPRYRLTIEKIQRFEAGNPPLGLQKWTLPMQYLGFMLMFMAAEPILAVILILSAQEIYALTVIAFVMLLPAIYVAYKYSEEIAKLRGGVHG